VLDATWARTALFWWPAFGWARVEAPETTRSPVVGVALELAAVALGLWAWRRYDLVRPVNRQRLVRHGHLARAVLR
jgi:hypothetical protein